MVEQLDLTAKEAWTMENACKIAESLMFVPDYRFIQAYQEFLINTVAKASLPTFLLLVAQNYFTCIKPPLERTTASQRATL